MNSPITPFVDINRIEGYTSIFNVMSYGATGNGVIKQDGAQGSSAADFTSASGIFTSADVGKVISIFGGGDSGGVMNLTTTIAAVISATEITLASSLLYAVSGATYVYGTDDTAAIQAAINATAMQDYGKVYFPEGVFIVNGPFQSSSVGNAQLTLPLIGPNSIGLHILLEGSLAVSMESGAAGGLSPYGTIIFSTIVGTTGGPNGQSVLGTYNAAGTFGPFNNVNIGVVGLTFFTVSSPNHNVLNFYYALNAWGQKINITPGVVWSNIVFSGLTSSYALITPKVLNYGYVIFDKITIAGYYVGLLAGEHASIPYVVISKCVNGISIQNSEHVVYIGYACLETNLYNLNVIGSAKVKIGLMDIEHNGVTIADINDPSNYLVDSEIIYHVWEPPTPTLLQIGATGNNVSIRLLGSRYDSPSIPIVYTGQQNFGMIALAPGATVSWNLNTQQVAALYLNQNATLANPTNQVPGGRYVLEVINQGSYTLLYGTAYVWPGGTAPVVTAGAGYVSLLEFLSDGTNMMGTSWLNYHPSFTPASVAGLTLWFDASNAASITQSGGSVSEWNDLSLNGNNLTQSNGSAQPTIQTAAQNGLNTIRFTSANSQLMNFITDVNVDAAYSIFAVMRRGGPTGANIVELFGHLGLPNNASLEWFSDEQIYAYDSTGYVTTPFASSSAYNQVDANITSSLGVINFNGTQAASGALTATGSTGVWGQLGYSDGKFCNGEIAEVIVYNSVISSGSAAAVRAYLKAKWGTP